MRNAAVIRANATTEKEQLLARARSEAEALKGQGDAEAAKHFEVFAKNPDLAIYLRKIRALQETLKTKTTIIVDPSIPPFDLFSQGFTGAINQPSVTAGAGGFPEAHELRTPRDGGANRGRRTRRNPVPEPHGRRPRRRTPSRRSTRRAPRSRMRYGRAFASSRSSSSCCSPCSWLQGFFTVQSDQKAIILRFGAYEEGRVKDQGMHYAFPYPIDRVVPVWVRPRKLEVNTFWSKISEQAKKTRWRRARRLPEAGGGRRKRGTC